MSSLVNIYKKEIEMISCLPDGVLCIGPSEAYNGAAIIQIK